MHVNQLTAHAPSTGLGHCLVFYIACSLACSVELEMPWPFSPSVIPQTDAGGQHKL